MAEISAATEDVIKNIVFAAERQDRQFSYVIHDMEQDGEEIHDITRQIADSFAREKKNAEFVTACMDETWDEDALLRMLKAERTRVGDSHVLNLAISEVYAGSAA